MNRHHHLCRRAQRGFTLIELLVVMSIISLLLSLLLPSLSGALRVGRKTSCLANLRNYAQASAAFATDNDDDILGSPATSGAYLAGQTVAYGAAIQRWDFMGPMAKMLGIDLYPNGEAQGEGSNPNAAKRFNSIRTNKAFICPSNAFLSVDYQGPPAGTNRMISYNTVRWGLMVKAASANVAGFTGDAAGTSWYSGFDDVSTPNNFRPKVAKMGVPSNKVYVADGARYSDCATKPDHDITVQAGWGGAFSDGGPFQKTNPTGTHSWDRTMVPGNGAVAGGSTDGRTYAFRHSTGSPANGAPGNAYKANAIFFDGHGETQGDLDFSNPFQWVPQNTTLNIVGIWADTVKRFGLPSTDFNAGP